MSNHVKRQHYVPRFLLTHFANDGGLVWTYDKTWKTIRQKGVGGLAFENYFYDIQPGEKEGSLEYRLGILETHTAPIIEKIIANKNLGILTVAEKEILAMFISVQLNRTKAALKNTERIQTQFIEPIKKFAQEMNAKFEYEEIPIKEFWLSTFENTIEFSEILLKKIWFLVESDKKFYSSDHPVALGNYLNRHKSPYRGILGLNSDGIEIYFPLSPSVLLCLYCERSYKLATDKIVQCSSENIEYYNHLQAHESNRFIFASQDDFWLVEDMIAKQQLNNSQE